MPPSVAKAEKLAGTTQPKREVGGSGAPLSVSFSGATYTPLHARPPPSITNITTHNTTYPKPTTPTPTNNNATMARRLSAAAFCLALALATQGALAKTARVDAVCRGIKTAYKSEDKCNDWQDDLCASVQSDECDL